MRELVIALMGAVVGAVLFMAFVPPPSVSAGRAICEERGGTWVKQNQPPYRCLVRSGDTYVMDALIGMGANRDSTGPIGRLIYRWRCIDGLDREWGQPFYAYHPHEAKQVAL